MKTTFATLSLFMPKYTRALAQVEFEMEIEITKLTILTGRTQEQVRGFVEFYHTRFCQLETLLETAQRVRTGVSQNLIDTNAMFQVIDSADDGGTCLS